MKQKKQKPLKRANPFSDEMRASNKPRDKVYIVTMGELMNAHGVTQTTAEEWIRKGMPNESKNGVLTFNLAETIRWRVERLTKRDELSSERARLAREQADHTAMKNAERRGELIEMELVTEYVTKIISASRAKLLSLPRKLAPVVRFADTDAKCEAILEAHIHESLEELSNEQIRVSIAQTDEEGEDKELHLDDDEDMAPTAKVDREPMGRRQKKTKPRSKRRTRAMED